MSPQRSEDLKAVWSSSGRMKLQGGLQTSHGCGTRPSALTLFDLE